MLTWHLVGAFVWLESTAEGYNRRLCVQSAAVTSGELYHSSLKNMQIVMLDYFYVSFPSLILLEAIRATTCQKTKQQSTLIQSDPIVALVVGHLVM